MTDDVVFAVFLMVFVAVLAPVAKLVLTPCRRSDVSGAVFKGVVDGYFLATCHSADGYVSDGVSGMMRRGLDLR